MQNLIVKAEALILAPVAKVWEVLVAPRFIRQWDALPEDFLDYYLEVGREIEWSGFSKMIVTEAEPHERLRFSLFVAKWELPPSAYDIGYTYTLSESAEGTLLVLEIGDFADVPGGQEYYDTSLKFAGEALSKIKKLSENRI